MVGWIKMPLGTEVGLGPGHIVLDGEWGRSSPRWKGEQHPHFSADVYCGEAVAHLSNCWALVWDICDVNFSDSVIFRPLPMVATLIGGLDFQYRFRFSLCGTKPTDWLGKTSVKWPISCQVGRETLKHLRFEPSVNQAVNLFVFCSTGWPQTWKTWNTQGFLCTWKTHGILRKFCATSEKTDFVLWVQPVLSNPYAAKCIWCTKTVDLRNMGRQALVSHMSSSWCGMTLDIWRSLLPIFLLQ